MIDEQMLAVIILLAVLGIPFVLICALLVALIRWFNRKDR